MSTATLSATGVRADIADLHDSISHLVASALDAGGATWEVAAPLVHGLLDGPWNGEAPVAVARALGKAQMRQAAAVEQALAADDADAVSALAAELRRAHQRLATVLGH